MVWRNVASQGIHNRSGYLVGQGLGIQLALIAVELQAETTDLWQQLAVILRPGFSFLNSHGSSCCPGESIRLHPLTEHACPAAAS